MQVNEWPRRSGIVSQQSGHSGADAQTVTPSFVLTRGNKVMRRSIQTPPARGKSFNGGCSIFVEFSHRPKITRAEALAPISGATRDRYLGAPPGEPFSVSSGQDAR